MISPEEFYTTLLENRVEFFTGVPDSLLADFCAYIEENTQAGRHVIAANEGNAVALATGYHLATRNFGLVYLQNSGLGNTVNPLVSLTDPLVYGVPVLLLIGWRGEEGVADEPQHKKQGKITLSMLETLGIPYEILPEAFSEAQEVVAKAQKHMKEKNAPFALVVKKGIFSPYEKKSSIKHQSSLSRETAIECVATTISKDAVIVSTTGKLSRELFELRARTDKNHMRDFLTVGSMGHASSIALGIALAQPDRKVYCFDGDGAAIMHLGSFCVIGQHTPKKYVHIIFNNLTHDSVGGQPTAAATTDFISIAKACGYKNAFKVTTKEEIMLSMSVLTESDGPSFLEICIKSGARNDLGRPTRTPIENKDDFMNFLEDNE